MIRGFGDYYNDGYNGYVSLEFRRQGDITYAQRAGTGGAAVPAGGLRGSWCLSACEAIGVGGQQARSRRGSKTA